MTLLAAVAAAAWVLAAVVLLGRRPWWSAWALGAAAALVAGLVTGDAAVGAALMAVVATDALLRLPGGPRRQWRAAAVVVVAAVAGLAAIGAWWAGWSWLALGAGTAAGLAGAWTRQAAAAPMERRRAQVVVLGVVVAGELAAIAWTVGRLLAWHDDGVAALLVGGLVLPVAVVAAAARRLGPWVDRLLGVAAVTGGVSSALAAVVLVVVAALGGRPDGAERDTVVISLGAAAVAAAVLPGVVTRLRTHANRAVYGAVDSPDDVARAFGARLTRAVPLDELLLQLAETLCRALRAEAAEVWTASSGVLVLSASVPHVEGAPVELDASTTEVLARAGPSGGGWSQLWLPELAVRDGTGPFVLAPLAHAGQLLGVLVVRRAGDGDPYDDRDHQVLADLARQVGIALHNLVLDTALAASVDELRHTNDELRASRARLVASGDAERRRIERNLHDGAQQHLVALAVQVRLVSDALGAGDHADARHLLEVVRTTLLETVAELRALAHGIYPPLLASGGLHEALPAAATRAGTPVTIVACPPGRFAEDVEAATYFCCLEAMQNTAKHAGAHATATIELVEQDGFLEFSVTDDGVGFDPRRASPGQGTTNMADRVGAIGGELSVVSAPGHGTAVRGRLPLGPTGRTATATGSAPSVRPRADATPTAAP